MTLIWKMDRACVAHKEQRFKHIDHAMSLGLPEFWPTDSIDEDALSLCASGPSLRYHLEDIKSPIMAINAAHDFLIERGIIPNYAMSIDPQPKTIQGFQRKHKDVQYFLASQCHPEFFTHLEDMQVTIFHLLGGSEREYLRKHRCFFVGGGSTSGLRAMTLAYLMGYQKQNLFGFDSCYLNGDRNVDKPMDRNVLTLEVNHRDFLTNPEFAAQADEFQDVLFSMEHLKVNVFGDGLIAEIMKARKQYLSCKHAAS